MNLTQLERQEEKLDEAARMETDPARRLNIRLQQLDLLRKMRRLLRERALIPDPVHTNSAASK